MVIKKLILSFLFMILILGSVSAFLDVKHFNPDIPEYGEIEIDDWLFTKKANYRLTDYDASVINVWAEGEYELFQKTHLFTGVFYKDTLGKKGDLKNIKFFIWVNESYEEVTPIYETNCEEVFNITNQNNSQVCESVFIRNETETKYKEYWKPYEKGMDLDEGKGRWRLEAERPKNKKIDFILEAHGKTFDEWAWWDNFWEFKRAINITETSGTTLSNYTINFSVAYDSDMQNDFDDLRFLNSDETTEYPYWIESKTDGSTANVYVRIANEDLTASSTKTIYMYYGNSSVSSKQNKNNTFLFSDDFGGTSIDNNKWDTFTQSGCTLTQNNGLIFSCLTNARTSVALAKYNSSEPLRVTQNITWTEYPAGNSNVFYSGLGTSETSSHYTYASFGSFVVVVSWGKWSASTREGIFQTNTLNEVGSKITPVQNQNYKVGFNEISDTSRNYDINYSTRLSGTKDVSASYPVILMQDGDTSATFKINDYRIQRYSSSEPTYTFGEEESFNLLTTTLNSPINYFNTTSSSVDFNCSATDETGVLNLTLIIDGADNETLVGGVGQNLTLETTKTLTDGTHNWTCRAEDGTISSTPSVRYLTIDSTAPSVSVTYPTGTIDSFTIGSNLTLNWTASDTNLDSCWYEYNGVNNTITCSANTTSFEYVSGQNSIKVYANDTFGNLGSDSSSWSFDLIFINQNNTNSTVEGSTETFSILSSVGLGSSLDSAIFIINNTAYTTNIDFSGGVYNISSTVSIPLVSTDTNMTYYFNATIDGVSYSSELFNISVENLEFGICGGTNTDILVNFSLKDEGTRTSINGDIELNADLIGKVSGNVLETINATYSNVSSAIVCFTPEEFYDLYEMNILVRYESEDYVPEFYTLQKADLGEYPKNISLFDLKANDSTEFLVKYQDESLTTVEGAVIQLLREYIGLDVSEVVEAPTTSNIGTAVVHIDLNTNKYNIIVVKDGVVLDIFPEIVFDCENELSGECTQNLFGDIDPQNIVSVTNLNDITYAILENNESLQVVFSIPSGSPSTINVYMEQMDMFGNESICNQTITSSGGTIECTYDETIGDSQLNLKIFKDGELQAQKGFLIKEGSGIDFGNNNLIILLVLLLSLAGMSVSSPEWIVVNGVITMVLAGGIYLINGLDFVIGLGNLIWIVLAGSILVYKMTTQEDR